MTDPIVEQPAVTFHGDPYPPYCCPNCESRRIEALDLRARANLLRDAIELHDDEIVVRHHAAVLLEMLWKRGVA